MNEKKIKPTDAMIEAVQSVRKYLVLDVGSILSIALNHPDARGLFVDQNEGPDEMPEELPTNPGAVIIPAEGNEYITATVASETWHARDAVLVCGQWRAAWRTHAGRWIGWVTPKQITPDIWKVEKR